MYYLRKFRGRYETGTRPFAECQVGCDGEDPKLFAGHSLRSGLVTDLLDAGVDPFRVADSVDHKHLSTTRKYDRRDQKLENSTSKAFGKTS
jgi:hypothetical protein